MDHLAELEKKVDVIIKKLEQLKLENATLKGSAQQSADEIANLTSENNSLKNDLESIKSNTQEQEATLHAATEKIKSLIAKIDAA